MSDAASEASPGDRSASEAAPAGAPGIIRRLLSMAYEGTLLFAVAFIATWLFQFAAGGAIVEGWQRTALQLYLVAVFAAYFLWCWLRGGQTLAMKAWGIRLVALGQPRVTARLALKRLAYAGAFIGSFCMAFVGAFVHHNPWLAFLTLAISGIGLGWALFDRDRQFLYDRLAGTRLVLVDRNLTL